MNDFVLDICYWGLWILIEHPLAKNLLNHMCWENNSIISWSVWVFEHSESSITNIHWAGTGILNTRIRVFPEIFAFSLSLNKESFPTCFGVINIGKCRKRLIFLYMLMKNDLSSISKAKSQSPLSISKILSSTNYLVYCRKKASTNKAFVALCLKIWGRYYWIIAFQTKHPRIACMTDMIMFDWHEFWSTQETTSNHEHLM